MTPGKGKGKGKGMDEEKEKILGLRPHEKRLGWPGGIGDALRPLSVGDIIFAGSVNGEVAKIGEGDDDTIGVYFPSSSKVNWESDIIRGLRTEACKGTVRARGKHLMGEGTDFTRLEEGDVITAGCRIGVVSDIQSDRLLTVHDPFDMDIDVEVNFYFTRPEKRSGTIVSDGVEVRGNKEDEELESAVFRSAAYVSDNYRAVTTEDYESLASKVLRGIFDDADFRVVCRNNRNFEWRGMGSERPGHVSLFIIARSEQAYLYKRKSGIDEIVKLVAEITGRTSKREEIKEDIEKSKLWENLEETVGQNMANGFEGARAVEAVETAVSKAVEDLNAYINSIDESDEKRMRSAFENAYFYIVSGKVLEKVESFLDPRRLLTTRVHAVYPRFRKFGIDASLQIMKGVDEETLKKEAAEKLKLFFDPIDGGPGGSGWPLGRSLYKSEVCQALEGVSGVDHVLSLAIVDDFGENIVELNEDELIELDCTIELKRG